MITPIEILRSRVTPLLRADVDTDQMIAKQYLRRLTRTGYGDALFAEWRKDPSFVLNDRRYDGSEILLAGPNFGCGSAREHAVWGLIDYGFRAVVAPSFAGSFYLNAISSGLLPAQITFTEYLELAEVAASRGLSTMTIDLPGQRLDDPGSGAWHERRGCPGGVRLGVRRRDQGEPRPGGFGRRRPRLTRRPKPLNPPAETI